MTLIQYLIGFQILVFVGYIAWIWSNHGVLPSISDSWYELKKRGKFFSLFIWSIAITTFIIGGLQENLWFLGSGFALFFVGAATAFRKKTTGRIHGAAAVLGIALAFAGLVNIHVFTPVIAFAVVTAFLVFFDVKDLTWWTEIAAFVFIEIGLLI